MLSAAEIDRQITYNELGILLLDEKMSAIDEEMQYLNNSNNTSIPIQWALYRIKSLEADRELAMFVRRESSRVLSVLQTWKSERETNLNEEVVTGSLQRQTVEGLRREVDEKLGR